MEKKKNKIWIYVIGGITAGFLNGLFGSGGGTLVVPFMTEFLGVNVKKAHATAILIISALTSVSLIFYGINSMLDFKLALYVSSGGVVGGFIGAKLLSNIPENLIRKIFGAFMIIAAIRMVFK